MPNQKEYIVTRTNQSMPLNGIPWKGADVLHVDQFPWYTSGIKQTTETRLLYDDQAIYVQFICQDRHINSEATELNGKVWLDSCVEFFASPEPDKKPDYFNLEMNCCGTFLMGYSPGREARKHITPEMASKVTLITSVPGPTKAESSKDDGWWAAARLPLEVIAQLTGMKIQPQKGTAWRANFYRCGGKTDVQFGCWSPIDIVKHPVADFHRPEYFGQLIFG